MPHFVIVLKLYINLFNLSRSDNKMSIFEEDGALKQVHSITC